MGDIGIKHEADLYNQIYRLEATKQMLQAENMELAQKLKEHGDKLERMQITPLLIGTVSDLMDDNMILVKNTNGAEFLVSANPDLMLEPGMKIAMNQQTMSIVRTLPITRDTFLRAAEVIEKPNISFKDVGGMALQLQELQEVVELPLTNPELFKNMGIEPPKGVLLFGHPGCGKTLIAKAIANSTNATFIKLVGSELVRKFIGEGAKVVKQTFNMAKEKAPTILFIDEIDAVAGKRLYETTGGDREVNRTLMQLLAEMDGFDSSDDVKIIGATNRLDILDPAILRPGRFDRIIEIPLPDKVGRKDIFNIHMKDMKFKRVNINKLSDIEMLTGAEIKAICTEAGMFAIRERRNHATQKDFDKAVSKIVEEEELEMPPERYIR